MSKTQRKSINIDGKDVKVSNKIYGVIHNLTEALKQHEVALLTWVHKVFNEKTEHTKDEVLIQQYCMQIPDAPGILSRMRQIDEEVAKKGSDESANPVGDAENSGSSDTEE